VPDQFVKIVTRGLKEAKTEIHRIDKRCDLAAVAGLKAVQRYGVKMTKSKMRGRPRWGHRGRSRIWPEPVDLGFYHNPRAGSIGKFTGHLAKGVGQVKRPRKVGDTFKGGVGIGGRDRNVYKGKSEAKFPFFRPAMKQVEQNALPLWEKAMLKVHDK
jgi:hypothetical protein